MAQIAAEQIKKSIADSAPARAPAPMRNRTSIPAIGAMALILIIGASRGIGWGWCKPIWRKATG
jgi:hypothetical protein